MAALPRLLVADAERSVRAGVAQQLAASYEVVEVADGEAAWQMLVVDPAIRLLIIDQQLPKLDGLQLLERLRSSRLRHLQQLPVLLSSDADVDVLAGRLRGFGLAAQLLKGGAAGSGQLQGAVETLLATSAAGKATGAAGEQRVDDPNSGLFTRKYLELQAAQALSHSARHGVDLGILVIGFDSHAELADKFGPALAEEVGNRFARLLATKMRQEDSLGHFAPGQYAVVSPGASLVQCGNFAERIRQAVEVARLTMQGQALALTVSIGLASVPADRVFAAGALLNLAQQRMQAALRAGGNRVEGIGEAVVAPRQMTVAEALGLLQAGRIEAVRPNLDALLAQLLPLLQVVDQQLPLTLPLADIERYLGERQQK